jgi:hypothetical protein
MFRSLSVSACAIAAIVASAAPTGAAAPTLHAVPPAPAAPAAQHGVARFRIGKFEVVALSDGTLPLDVHPLLKGLRVQRLRAGIFSAASRAQGSEKDLLKSSRGARKSRKAFTLGGWTRPPGRTA